MQWLNEPPVWKADDGRLRVVSGAKTDFWRITHYGFVRDNGHFYYEQKTGDFTAQVKIEAKYEALYDQAGIMIRSNAANWIKAGIEYTEGLPHFSDCKVGKALLFPASVAALGGRADGLSSEICWASPISS